MATLATYSEHSLGAVGQIALANTLCNIVLSIVAIKALGKLGAQKTMFISVIACAAHMMLYTLVTPGANPQSLVFMYAAGGVASLAITFGTHAVWNSIYLLIAGLLLFVAGNISNKLGTGGFIVYVCVSHKNIIF